MLSKKWSRVFTAPHGAAEHVAKNMQAVSIHCQIWSAHIGLSRGVFMKCEAVADGAFEIYLHVLIFTGFFSQTGS